MIILNFNATACTHNDNCTAPKSVCKIPSGENDGTCVECINNRHCNTDDKKYCDTFNNICVECVEHGHCEDEAKPYCTLHSDEYFNSPYSTCQYRIIRPSELEKGLKYRVGYSQIDPSDEDWRISEGGDTLTYSGSSINIISEIFNKDCISDESPCSLNENIFALGFLPSLGDYSEVFYFGLNSGYENQIVPDYGTFTALDNVAVGFSDNYQAIHFAGHLMWSLEDPSGVSWNYHLPPGFSGVSTLDLGVTFTQDPGIILYNVPVSGLLFYVDSDNGYFAVYPAEKLNIYFHEQNDDGVTIAGFEGEYKIKVQNSNMHAILKDVYFYSNIKGSFTFNTDGSTGILDIGNLVERSYIEFYSNERDRAILIEKTNNELRVNECNEGACTDTHSIATGLQQDDIYSKFNTEIKIMNGDELIGIIRADGDYEGSVNYTIIDEDCPDDADETSNCNKNTDGAQCVYNPLTEEWSWDCSCLEDCVKKNIYPDCATFCNNVNIACAMIGETFVCCDYIEDEKIFKISDDDYTCCLNNEYFCDASCSTAPCNDELECPDDYEYCGDYCSNDGCSHEQNPCTLAGAECGYLGDDTETTSDATDNAFSDFAEQSGTQAGSGSIYCGGCSGEQTCDANNQCILGNDPDPDCDEDWDCTDWTECVDGQQTRTCTDLNDCGTTESRPSLDQSCEPNPECEIDDDCLQGQECNDDGNCDNIIPQIINIGAR
ncbi:MAG: hypothetical protein ACOC2W_02015 [bacterium]